MIKKKKTIKILLISPLPPPVGGIANWTQTILPGFEDKNYKIIHLNNAIKFRRITNINLIIRILTGFLSFLLLYLKYIWILVKSRPQIVHFTSSASLSVFKDILLVLIGSCFKTNVVIHYRFGRIPDLMIKKNWEWLFIKWTVKLCFKTIVLDLESAKSLRTIKDTVVVLNNPMGSLLQEIAERELKNIGKDILYVGHVVRNKGIFDLVRACLDLRFQNSKLKIIGPVEEAIKYEIKNLAKNSSNGLIIEFFGVLNKDEIYKHMLASGVLVLPSYTEGFPNVILEGMSLGCSIIASKVGAIPEMLADERGILINIGDKLALTDHLERLLTDNSERIRLGNKAKAYALKNYGLRENIFALETIWDIDNL